MKTFHLKTIILHLHHLFVFFWSRKIIPGAQPPAPRKPNAKFVASLTVRMSRITNGVPLTYTRIRPVTPGSVPIVSSTARSFPTKPVQPAHRALMWSARIAAM